MDVRMAEKNYDKKRLLTTIRNEIDPNGSNNSSTGFRHEYFARNLDPDFQMEANSERNRLFEKRLNELSKDFESSRLGTSQQSPYQAQGLHGYSPRHQAGRDSFLSSPLVEDDHLTQVQEQRQEDLRQLIQSNMARLNGCHHRINTAMVKRGYDVSKDNIEIDLYCQKNLIASTDPELLSSNYEARIAMLTEINTNLNHKLQKKKEMLALLTENNSKSGISRSEPRRSERLRNQKKKSLDDDFLYY